MCVFLCVSVFVCLLQYYISCLVNNRQGGDVCAQAPCVGMKQPILNHRVINRAINLGAI